MWDKLRVECELLGNDEEKSLAECEVKLKGEEHTTKEDEAGIRKRK